MRGIWALPWHSLGSLDLTRGTFNNKVCKIGQNNSFFSLNLSSGDLNSNTWAITKKCNQKEMPKAQKKCIHKVVVGFVSLPFHKGKPSLVGWSMLQCHKAQRSQNQR